MEKFKVDSISSYSNYIEYIIRNDLNKYSLKFKNNNIQWQTSIELNKDINNVEEENSYNLFNLLFDVCIDYVCENNINMISLKINKKELRIIRLFLNSHEIKFNIISDDENCTFIYF